MQYAREIQVSVDDRIATMRSVFMGSPEFALPALESLESQTQIVGVVTQPDRPAGRGREMTRPPIKILAEKLGLPLIQPATLRTPEALDQLRAWHPDIIVVTAFGQILRPEVLSLPRYGCVNLHASLLPQHRGASPIAAAILAGDLETGVTLMKMDPGLDTGPVLGARRLSIQDSDTSESLGQKLSLLAAETLTEFLPVYLRGEITPRPQDESRATYAPRLRKEDGRMDFQQPAEILDRKVRAFHPWPGTYTLWKGQPLRILEVRSEPGGRQAAPGMTVEKSRFPAIQTVDGFLILLKVQPSGKRVMAGDEFLRGAREFLSQVLD
jgi:methionyl-tRNA formyltransferase